MDRALGSLQNCRETTESGLVLYPCYISKLNQTGIYLSKTIEVETDLLALDSIPER